MTESAITPPATAQVARSLPLALAAGALIGVLGGMIGLGGAEFRLPLLIGLFGFIALQAVIVNKAMSLIVVLTALPARLLAVPLDDVTARWAVVVNLLAGSLVGAWIGATWACPWPSRYPPCWSRSPATPKTPASRSCAATRPSSSP